MAMPKTLKFFSLLTIVIPVLGLAGPGEMTTKYFPKIGETKYLCVIGADESNGIVLSPAGGVDIKPFSKMDMEKKKDYILYLYTPSTGCNADSCTNNCYDPHYVIVGSTWFTPHDNNGVVTVDIGNIFTDGSMEINPTTSPVNGATEIDFTYIK